MKDALPEAVKEAHADESKPVKTKGIFDIPKSYEEEDEEDFNEADLNQDGRLNFDEYKIMQERIFRRTFERGTSGILYTEE